MSTQPADSGGDIVVTDQDLYDHATSDPAPAPAPAEPVSAPAEPASVPQQQGVPRDDQGRFAPKQPREDSGETTTQQPAPQQPPQQQRQTEDHRVPVATLLQERERAYRAEAELQQMRQAYAQWQQQIAQQQPPPQAPQTIFDDPDNYLMQRYIAPLREEGKIAIMKVKDDLSRDSAERQFGEQTVNEALQALKNIRQSPHGEYLFTQIMQQRHPYGALVQWHKQARAHQQVGPDPEAWFKQRAMQLLDDPKWQAAAIERARARAGQQQQAGSSNVQLPPSLSSMPASSGRLGDQGDLSNESLYRFAIK